MLPLLIVSLSGNISPVMPPDEEDDALDDELEELDDELELDELEEADPPELELDVDEEELELEPEAPPPALDDEPLLDEDELPSFDEVPKKNDEPLSCAVSSCVRSPPPPHPVSGSVSMSKSGNTYVRIGQASAMVNVFSRLQLRCNDVALARAKLNACRCMANSDCVMFCFAGATTKLDCFTFSTTVIRPSQSPAQKPDFRQPQGMRRDRCRLV